MKISACSSRPVLNKCSLENHDYQVDPYIGCAHLCHYCYALNTSETEWSEEILVYEDIVKQLEGELETLSPQTIYMGWKTDPYQPCEADVQQTRKVLELLRDKGFSASILTKSDLIVRDLDILRSMDCASVSFSIAFADDGTRSAFEANTMTTKARIEALRQCHKAGLRTSAMICPVIPHVSNVMPLIDQVAQHIDKLWVFGLSILDKSEMNWRNVQGILDQHYPEDRERIEDAIFDKDNPYWSELRLELLEKYEKEPFELSVHF